MYRAIGQMLTVPCCASASKILGYYWYRARGEIKGSSVGLTSKILVIPDVGFDDTGVYVCLVATQTDVHIHTIRLIVTGIQCAFSHVFYYDTINSLPPLPISSLPLLSLCRGSTNR